jgi:hypothetical protein
VKYLGNGFRTGCDVCRKETKRGQQACARVALDTHLNFSSFTGFKARQQSGLHEIHASKMNTKIFVADVNPRAATLERF